MQARSAVGLTTLTDSSLQAGAEILQCAVLRNTRVRNLNKPLDLNQTKLLIRVQEKCLKMGSLWGCVTILGATLKDGILRVFLHMNITNIYNTPL